MTGLKPDLSNGWRELRPHKAIIARDPNVRNFQKDMPMGGDLNVLVSPPMFDMGWHLSISHRLVTGPSGKHGNTKPGRYPTWDEIKDARRRFLPPDRTFAMMLPPDDQYVNIHDTTFHLWEVMNPNEGVSELRKH